MTDKPNQIDNLLAEVGAKCGLSDELCPNDGFLWATAQALRSMNIAFKQERVRPISRKRLSTSEVMLRKMRQWIDEVNRNMEE